MLSAEEAPVYRKNRQTEAGAFFYNVVLMVKSDRWNHALCVCALCVCMSVVKADVLFGTDEALAKGKTGWIGCSALLPSLL